LIARRIGNYKRMIFHVPDRRLHVVLASVEMAQ
jgi:hypothetical protein